MREKQNTRIFRRKFTLAAVTGLSIALAGCEGQDPNQTDPGEAPTEPDNLVINSWKLTAVESTGDSYKLECSISIQNTETNYSVASNIEISTEVDGYSYSESDEIAVKSGSTAEFRYDLGDGDLPEEIYHSINANKSNVIFNVLLEGEERINKNSSGPIEGSK